MKKIVYSLALLTGSLLLSPSAYADGSAPVDSKSSDTSGASAAHSNSAPFVVKHITIEGLQRISSGTVYTYLPIKVDDDLTASESNDVITALFKTGFFSDVKLYRDKDTLVIKVVERPVVGEVSISGNNAIKTKELQEGLKKIGLSEGLTYNSALADKIKTALVEQYYTMGYYDASVDITVKDEPRNRVGLSIKITEGPLAIIKQINIIGNQAFTNKTLIKQMQMATTKWYSWLTHNDRYSREKMQADTQALASYYLDNGYLRFKIDSETVQVTPDKSGVYITIHVTEGPQYKVSGFSVEGKTVIPNDEMTSQIDMPEGSTFSRKKVVDSENTIKDMLGKKGYAFATVTADPKIDDDKHTVFISFKVTQGPLVYIRDIKFTGNNKTNDNALRSKLAMVEQSVINTDDIKQSKRQLSQLPYIRNVDIKTEKVPETDDKVDLDVSLEEIASAQISAGIGYSEVDGIILNGSIVQKNLFGTGKTLSVNLVNSDYEENYSVSYINPFFTTNGISRGMTAYIQRYDPSAANISSDYSYDEAGGRIFYNIPMSASVGATNSVNLGYGFVTTHLDVDEDDASTQAQDFKDDYGDDFNQLELTAGWVHNGLNRYVFPTAGFKQSFGVTSYVPADSDSLGYYKSTYQAESYFPISSRYILQMRGELGYGAGFINTSDIPFYRNYFAGGLGTVRGYEGNTLGPRDSNDDPFGGNFLMDGTVSMIFPNFISPDNVRTSLFVDGGTVYDLEGQTTDDGFSTNKLRYGTGIDLQWLSPVGLLEFSLADAINPDSNDNTQVFDFRIGASF